MCGIVGYVGNREAVPLLLEGLHRLEYRGYDSAGLAIIGPQGIICEKVVGKVAVLEETIKSEDFLGHMGIAHTRWATHGEPNLENAHPHLDCKGEIAVVHNGIVENYVALREFLKRQGHTFTTQTDTEVLAHLIESNYKGDLLEAVRLALVQVQGTYGLAVVSKHHPDQIVVARNGSPLVIGKGIGEHFVGSDVAAIRRHTTQVVYLEDGEVASVMADDIKVQTIDKVAVTPEVEEITGDLGIIEKDGFSHFMLKEIFEQPITLRNTLRGRLDYENGTARLDGLTNYEHKLRNAERIVITACGTSWHSALIGEYLLEEFARVPVEVEYASEFRYRSPVVDDRTVVLVISQSGETADTLAAMREAKRRGAIALGVCNVVGSSIARETDAGVYIHAGPEIGVASTKAFTSQTMVLAMITLLLGRMRTLSVAEGREMVEAILKVPEQVGLILKNEDQIKEIAAQYAKSNNFLYLGRGYNFPVALEGALKLKEISYVHAEGYPAAEMKHGPIALIDENMPVVFIATRDSVYEKVLNNIEEVRARRGKVIVIATQGDEQIKEKADHIIYIPQIMEFLSPLLTVIPLQLLAYHIAVLRGCAIDQPRNLAKSVTVE
jgi:glucosamine--fructose-6-phosphate aminotransferase (isomerizing)